MNGNEGGRGGVPSRPPRAVQEVQEVHLHLRRRTGIGAGDDARWRIEGSADGRTVDIATLAALLDWLASLEPRPRGIR